MKSVITTSLVLFALCISCSEKGNAPVRYSSFPESVSLKHEKVEIPPVLLYPRNIYLIGDKLVVLNEKTDTLFCLFDKETLAFQKQFGVKGGGPNDFTLPMIQAVACDDESFTLCDINRLRKVRVDDSRSFQVESQILPYGFSYYNNLMALGESLYCCHAELTDENELMLLHKDGSHEKFGEYPENVEPRFKDALARNQAYNGLSVAQPNGNLLARFYQHIRRFRIYSNDGRLVSDNVMTIAPCHELPAVEDEKRYIHPIAVYATEQFIYTLNLDMTPEEIGQQAKNPNIQVFDWQGRPQRQYHLDCFISSFVIDEKNEVLYGVFANDMEHIYKFELKEK